MGDGQERNGVGKPFKRLKKNQELCEVIEDVSKCKHNEVVLSVFGQLVACLEKGQEYAMQLGDQKNEQIRLFGGVPNHPAPPLPYGMKWRVC